MPNLWPCVSQIWELRSNASDITQKQLNSRGQGQTLKYHTLLTAHHRTCIDVRIENVQTAIKNKFIQLMLHYQQMYGLIAQNYEKWFGNNM